MKILMVISESPPIKSGVSRVAEKLTEGLSARGHSVDILSLNDVPRKEFGEVRISSMPFKLGELKNRFRDYDLIHLHGPVPTFSDVFLLGGLRKLGSKRPRLVYTHHAPIDLKVPLLQPFIWAYNRAQEWLARLADHVVVTTPSYAQRLSRFVPTGKLSVIPWGVDYPRFAAPVEKREPFTVVYLGQVRPYKGLPVLLNAAYGLKDTRLWVIGNGHLMDSCQRLASNLALKDIKFWGNLPDKQVTSLLKEAHVIVLPSITRSEAFGIVLLEGMAAGLVPVASHLPGVADLVGNEGITFPPGNPLALHDILIRLQDDRALRSHLASLAQAKARLYSWERVTFGYDRIFKRLISPPVDAVFTPGDIDLHDQRRRHTRPRPAIEAPGN
jgi:glycosyltransferase involved in cell wall biosynthesis